MTRDSRAAKLDELAVIINSRSAAMRWSGAATPNLYQELLDLPLMLPAGAAYQAQSSGSTIFIASTSGDIGRVRIVPEMASRVTIEMNSEGFEISAFGSRNFDRIIVKQKRIQADPNAVEVSHLQAPLALLDEYADLRDAARNRSLTPQESAKRDKVLANLAREFQKRDSASRYPSYRSTPSSSGESITPSYSTRGG